MGPRQSNQVGTCIMANSTMETYVQLLPAGNQASCFDCHNAKTPGGIAYVEVSHLYNRIKLPIVYERILGAQPVTPTKTK
jgi:hypothetical protein